MAISGLPTGYAAASKYTELHDCGDQIFNNE
jgi:hypothetical protein